MHVNSESTRAFSASYGRIIWAPVPTFHDPNPPLTIDTSSLSDSVNESVSDSDSQTATAIFNVTVSESAAATDAQSAGLLISDTVSDSVATSDSQSGGLSGSGQSDDSSSVSDTQTATVIPTPPPPPPPVVIIIPCVNGTPAAIGMASDSSLLVSQGIRTATSGLRSSAKSSGRSGLRAIGVANKGC